MKCSLEQIVSITQGAVRIEQREDGIHFSRFTKEQQSVYEGTSLYDKTFATAGVALSFRTDSKKMKMRVAAYECTSRRAFAHDVLRNGRLIGQIGNLDQVPMAAAPGAGGSPHGPGPSLGCFEESYELGEGEKEIRIVFPWSVLSVLKELELDDGASLIPAERKRRILFFGDSITQGYSAQYPSRHYTVRLAEMLGAEGINKAVGGDCFRPALAAERDAFEPEDILVAYGTNDWSKTTWEVFEKNSLEFYRLLSEEYPDARIWALTPIWRADYRAEKPIGEFSRVAERIFDVAGRFPNITAVSGWDLIPHLSGFYGDKRLHPNDFGFRKYFGSLRRELAKAGIAGPFTRNGFCGERMFWQMNPSSGVLRITGEGQMDNWSDENEDAPWDIYREQIVSVLVGEGVASLGDRAFHHFPALASVSLPESLQTIGVNTFCGCTALREITVPEGVRILASKAFNECTGLETVHLPSTLQYIDMKAFDKDANLRRVIYGGSARRWYTIQISRQARGNDLLVRAERTCLADGAAGDRAKYGGDNDTCPVLPNSAVNRYDFLTGRIRDILAAGGDGTMYILDPKKFESPDKNPTKCGECTVIIFPKGTTMMIDGGNSHCVDRTLELVKAIGLKRVDYFVMSHSHSDHVNGAIKIAEYLYENGGSVGRYYAAPYSAGKEPELREYLRRHGTEMHEDVMVPYEFPEIDGVSVEILSPAEEVLTVCREMIAAERPGDAPVNNVSILMKFRFGQSSFLTGGDLYRDMERLLVSELGEKLQADVLKTNHHGTYTSSCAEWLDAVRPMIAFSEADDNGDQLLAEECERRGIAYYSEGLSGLIVIAMDGTRNYRVERQWQQSACAEKQPFSIRK